ncbi:hypothetical protein ACJX0J_038869, partial [Zea mays]
MVHIKTTTFITIQVIDDTLKCLSCIYVIDLWLSLWGGGGGGGSSSSILEEDNRGLSPTGIWNNLELPNHLDVFSLLVCLGALFHVAFLDQVATCYGHTIEHWICMTNKVADPNL